MITPVTFATHFEAFLAFAESQPLDRTIDHNTGNWCGCAVGDFHREADTIPPVGDDVNADDNESINESPLLQELQEEHMFVFESLNQGSVPTKISEDEHGEGIGYHEIRTYQGLAKFMRAYRGDDFDLFIDLSE